MPPTDNNNVRFFPERGDIEAGLGSVVVVKATGAGGAGVEIEESA